MSQGLDIMETDSCNWCKGLKVPHTYVCKGLYDSITRRYLRTFELMTEAFKTKRVSADLRIEMSKEIMEGQIVNQKLDECINGVTIKH